MSCDIEVKVVPQSGRQKCMWDKASRLKCYLLSPPEKGKANEELVDIFRRALRLPKNAIVIIAGQTARNKRLRIDADISFDAVLAALGIERQLEIE